MEERLQAFLFAPQTWIREAQGSLPLARYYQDKIAPVALFKREDYNSLGSKLVLLSDAEMNLLGLTVATTPFCGQIERHLYAKFVRTVKAHLSAEQIGQLDQLTLESRPQFLLSPKVWENEEEVIRAGISALLEALPPHPHLQTIATHRFGFTSPAVSGLSTSLIEELCQISLPNLSWLRA